MSDESTWKYEPTYTYAMRCLDTVKIGRSTDVAKRLRALQTSNPHPIVLLGARDDDRERDVHDRLKIKGVRRLNGEWFELTETAKVVLIDERLMMPVGGFPEWLNAQAYRDDPIGDLARDAQRDSRWPPQADSKSGVEGYLRDRGAGREALKAFRQAWKEWERR